MSYAKQTPLNQLSQESFSGSIRNKKAKPAQTDGMKIIPLNDGTGAYVYAAATDNPDEVRNIYATRHENTGNRSNGGKRKAKKQSDALDNNIEEIPNLD